MTTTDIDYEAEYNNRARVPEHPAIFERWRAAAKEFRDEMAAQGRAELGISYGPTARQFIDLFRAERDGRTLAVFVHGGYWRSLERAIFSHIARGFLPHGISVAVVGYDLCPQVRVADIVEQIRRACAHLWRRFGKRMFVYGHSAGGHLAACALATDWKAYEMPADAVPAACAISGVFD
jgi:arylformamidase